MIELVVGLISVVSVTLAAVVTLAWLRAVRRARALEARVRELTAPKPNAAQAHWMGINVPGDQKIPISVRDWDALKRGLWRSKIALEVAASQAEVILGQCSHMPLCPGKMSETEPCFAGCIDREKRLSANVILNAASQLMPVDVQKPADAPYFAPTREYFSETLSALAAAQAEIEILRKAVEVDSLDIAFTLIVPSDPPPTAPALPPAQLEESK